MTDPNKPKKGYLFLSPEAHQAWERGVRRNLAAQTRWLLLSIGVMIVLALLFAPLMKRLIPPTPKQTQVSRPPTSTPLPAAPAQNTDALSRTLLSDFAQMTSQYKTAAEGYVDQFGDLYSTSSFSSKKEAARLIKLVTDFDNLERQYNQSVHQLPARALAMANKAGLDTQGKNHFVLTFSFKIEDFLKALDSYQQAEDEWVQSTVELYTFTSKYSARIAATQQGHVTITDGQVRNQFNAELSKCRSAFAKWQAAGQEFLAAEKATTQQAGTAQATGVHAP